MSNRRIRQNESDTTPRTDAFKAIRRVAGAGLRYYERSPGSRSRLGGILENSVEWTVEIALTMRLNRGFPSVQPLPPKRKVSLAVFHSVALLAVFSMMLIVPTIGFAQANKTGDQPSETDPPKASPFQKDEVDIATEKAVAFLISQQKKNGSITSGGYDTTMTSLSIMAMASIGVQPGEPGPQGQAMKRALEFVLQDDRQDDKGYYGRADGSRMYGHGIVTLMLTEMLGMTTSDEQDKKLHDRCEKAIDLILSAQKQKKRVTHQGGWRYEPNSNDADLSASVWQLMALRSAKNDGLQVPGSAIRDAVGYLKRSYSSPLDRNGLPEKVGGFCYEPGRNRATFTMTAAGLLAMQVCGEYDSPLVAGAADWLLNHPPKWKERFCMYGTYYYAQGMYQKGGEHAKTARRLVKEMLLAKQAGDGSWRAESGQEKDLGKVYATSLSVLSLSVKHHFLPIYQK